MTRHVVTCSNACRVVEEENQALHAQLDEQTRTLHALSASEARLRATLESLPDEIWFTDAHGEIMLVNDIAVRNLGFLTRDEFFRNIDEALTPPVDYPTNHPSPRWAHLGRRHR